MSKLHMKSTPAEDIARRLRKKERKEERKRKREADANPSTSKRRRAETTEEHSRKWASSDEDDFLNPGPSVGNRPSHRHKPDYDSIQEEVEERRFLEKMFDEMDSGDRLDSIEAQFNDFTHIPGRWRRGSSTRMGAYAFETPDIGMTDHSRLDPRYMEDEEYTEWIRMGMYRLKHAQEYAEQECRKAANEVRTAYAKKKKEETARLERAAAEEQERKRREREERQRRVARQQYDHRWRALLSDDARSHEGRLKFVDIPWPILNAYKAETSTATPRVEDLTDAAIRNFLLPVFAANDAKEKRDMLREAMLRFHPDKFEGRMMRFVVEGEQGLVREGIAQVVRVLNRLLTGVVQ